MRIEELWRELEEARGETRERGDGRGKAWALRLAKPDPACALHAGVELATGRRGLLLRVERRLVPAKRLWPACRGLEVIAAPMDGGTALFGVALKDVRQGDLFTVLAEDLTRRVTEADTVAAQVSALLGGLARWQKFLAASLDGLTQEQQRGLWSELHFLREHLWPALGATAVDGWRGGQRAHQDFQLARGAVEVKTTLAKQPQTVRVTSERQLDASRWAALFLHVLALDMRDAESSGAVLSSVTTLPEMVASLRAALAKEAMAKEQFEDELLAYGYLDLHAPHYAGRGYAVRSSKFFRVEPKFPCVVEADLRAGVGDVNYALSVSACEPFKVKAEAVVTALTELSRKTRRKRYA